MRTIRSILAAPFFGIGFLFMAIAGLILGEDGIDGVKE